MSEPQTFTEKFKVTDCESDWNRKLTVGGFMRMVQQISTDHCDSLGMDDAFYQREGAVFLLARMTLRFERVPKVGETLTLTTMPELMHRALCKRVTMAVDEAGNPVAMCDSRWILVDTNTKHILRRMPQGFADLPFAEKVEPELDRKLLVPEVLEDCGVMQAVYSRCDRNHHMNNTRYGDAAADAIPLEQLREKSVVEMSIRYHNELPGGECAQLQRGQIQENCWYVRGDREGKCCFEADLTIG